MKRFLIILLLLWGVIGVVAFFFKPTVEQYELTTLHFDSCANVYYVQVKKPVDPSQFSDVRLYDGMPVTYVKTKGTVGEIVLGKYSEEEMLKNAQNDVRNVLIILGIIFTLMWGACVSLSVYISKVRQR